MREEGGSTGSTGHDSVIAAVLGLLLHGDAIGPGGEVRLVLRGEPRCGGTTKQLLLLRRSNGRDPPRVWGYSCLIMLQPLRN